MPSLNRVSTVLAMRRVARRFLAKGTFSMGDSSVLTTNTDGRMLYLAAEDETLTPVVLTRRRYEPGTSRLFCRLVRPGHRVLDIGANIGWFTLLAAERVGASGRVHSFEPQPRMFELLHRSVFANGLYDRAALHQMALGAAPGTAELHVVPGKFAGGTLRTLSDGELYWQNAKETTTIEVPMHTLDEVLAYDPRIDVIKIDVEGFERSVFDGAADVFKASPNLKMIMEFTPREHGPEMLDFLRSMGFRLHEISRLGAARRLRDDQELLTRDVVNLYLDRS